MHMIHIKLEWRVCQYNVYQKDRKAHLELRRDRGILEQGIVFGVDGVDDLLVVFRGGLSAQGAEC